MAEGPLPLLDPYVALEVLGIAASPRDADIRPLAGGWSGSRLWQVTRPSGSLVLRLLPGASAIAAGREAAIHTLARRFTIPAPQILAWGAVPGGAAMVMPLMPGIALARALLETSDVAAVHALGQASGTMLARIHAIPRDALVAVGIAQGGEHDPGDWLAWTGADPDPGVRHMLEPWRVAAGDGQLLHLDFHPENVLVDPGTGTITAVLDWTNACLGPPVADLARTRSILRLIATATLPDLPPGADAMIDAFTRGFMEGHARLHGAVDPEMMLAFDAWALDAQIADLTPKVGMPGTWLTDATLDRLRIARDSAIAAAASTIRHIDGE